jgi:hypothetical protein
VLPFDLAAVRERLEAQHPRLAKARALVAEGAVRTSHGPDGVAGEVRSDDVVHRVRFSEEDATCTCTWYAKHGGERGPCAHVLAVEIACATRP